MTATRGTYSKMSVKRPKSGKEKPDEFHDYKVKRKAYKDNGINTGNQIIAKFHLLPGYNPTDYCKGCRGLKRGRDVVYREGPTKEVRVPAEPCPCRDPKNIRPNHIVCDRPPRKGLEEIQAQCSPQNGSDLHRSSGQGGRKRGDVLGRRRRKRIAKAIERQAKQKEKKESRKKMNPRRKKRKGKKKKKHEGGKSNAAAKRIISSGK